MRAGQWLKWTRGSPSRRAKRQPRGICRVKLYLETMEDRTVPEATGFVGPLPNPGTGPSLFPPGGQNQGQPPPGQNPGTDPTLFANGPLGTGLGSLGAPLGGSGPGSVGFGPGFAPGLAGFFLPPGAFPGNSPVSLIGPNNTLPGLGATPRFGVSGFVPAGSLSPSAVDLLFAGGTSAPNLSGLAAGLDPSFGAGEFGGGVLVGGLRFTNLNNGGYNSAVFAGGLNLAAFNSGAFAGGGVNTGVIVGGLNSFSFGSGGVDDGGRGSV